MSIIKNTCTPATLFSGERFSVTYRLFGSETEARAKAEDICIEQTVEFPAEEVPEGIIRDHVFGRIEQFGTGGGDGFEAIISYANEIVAGELTQFMNVVFGNSSIKPGIRVEHLDLPASLLRVFKGPRFGRDGLRALLKVPKRPLLSTALKPMGLSSQELADLAYQFVLGGMDIIKDDHGLSDQSCSPFEERVRLCSAAVQKGSRETGQPCLYIPNITAPHSEVMKRARFAKEAGAGGMMVAPGLIGFDLMRELADDDSLALPILTHPALQGSFVTSRNGISHGVLFGQLARLAGADATIFPNFGGRFSFSREECKEIVTATAERMGELKPIFPAPGGGMSLDKVPDMLETYGQDLIFLIGGGLFRHGPDLVQNCRHFRKMVEAME
ncbi:MAG: ribulose 1,5-bisphosphate carboxylase large subunit [Nitrospirae bacterium GWC2_56_14]|nr:MAG: ribulose 1,5-bisphosphate carboxylase large subunit [Nitrospirae bacterium GWC2_56_14]